ncbi:MAG TPA: hypothetical protein VF212_08735 [Longimicrobiales bacterium]
MARSHCPTVEPGASTWLTIAVVEPGGVGGPHVPGRYSFTAPVSFLVRRQALVAGEGERSARRAAADSSEAKEQKER